MYIMYEYIMYIMFYSIYIYYIYYEYCIHTVYTGFLLEHRALFEPRDTQFFSYFNIFKLYHAYRRCLLYLLKLRVLASRDQRPHIP